jgi:hypothetical protein
VEAVTTLAGFLLARITDDQAAGEQAVTWPTQNGLAWVGPTPKTATLLAISGHRMLAECDAKRRIVEDMQLALEYDQLETYELVLQYLALPYAGHEDYRPEWKP